MIRSLRLASVIALTLLLAATASADRRKYAFTYGYATIAEGATELELYQTTRLNTSNSWEYRIEIEHGLSPRADLSVYQIFTQADGGSFKWDAFQLRGRYRLAEPGQFFMDPTAYLEYNRKLDLQRQNKLEAKLLLARDFRRLNLAVNPVYEFFWAPGDPVHEVGLDVGLSYELVDYKFSIGAESVTRYEMLKNEDNETASYFGPCASLAMGKTFYTVGYLFGITDDSDDARVRFLMGIEL